MFNCFCGLIMNEIKFLLKLVKLIITFMFLIANFLPIFRVFQAH